MRTAGWTAPTTWVAVAVAAMAFGGCSRKDPAPSTAPPAVSSATSAPGAVVGAPPVVGTAAPSPAAQPGVGKTDLAGLGGARPVLATHVGKGLDATKPAPLVLVLHGYGGTGAEQLGYYGLRAIADEAGFVVVAPDGTVDGTGRRFWNATDTCCNFEDKAVDDVAYLVGLVEDVKKRRPIDAKRVYVVGLSNGGSMAMRLACDAAPTFAAAVSQAGLFFSDPARCVPKEPVAFRHIHGTADKLVPYDGGPIGGSIHPQAKPRTLLSAKALVAAFAKADGCQPALVELPAKIDLDVTLTGAETTVARHEGCTKGSAAELWTVTGAGHVPMGLASLGRIVWDFFAAHPKP